MIYEMRFRVELESDDEALEFFVGLVDGGLELGTEFERSDIIKYKDAETADAEQGVVH